MTRRQKIILGVTACITILSGVLHYADAPVLLAFAVTTLALAGIAWMVSFATESVGARFGPGVTGVMQSTLGNLPEFFIVLFALSAGETVVAQTSLIGSLLANALLVLGVTIIVGARKSKDGVMRFHPRLPNDTMTIFLTSIFIIVILGVAVTSHAHAALHAGTISVVGAVTLLVVYGLWMNSYLRADAAANAEADAKADEEGTKEEPALPIKQAIILLAISGVGAAFVSEWFVATIDPAVKSLGISKAFAGLVIVAIAGNAVENGTALVLASKGKSDLAISIVKNSVSQISAFLWPLLIIVSLFFASSLTFVLSPVYIAALALTAISVWQITGDGEARSYEGAALIALYVIVAAVALYQ